MQDVGKTTQIIVKIKIRGVEETAHKKVNNSENLFAVGRCGCNKTMAS